MKHIISKEQISNLQVGAVLFQDILESGTESDNAFANLNRHLMYSVAGFTPIGWDDTELELQPINYIQTSSAAASESAPAGNSLPLNILGSELIGSHQWWV